MEVLPVGAELFLIDKQSDMTQLNVASLNFSNASEMFYLHILILRPAFLLSEMN
jgi:hypothetical protein